MAESVSLSFNEAEASVPRRILLAPGQDIQVESVTARWHGAGASGSFLACLAMYSQDGKLLSRTFPSQVMAPGDAGVVTYIPFLGGDQAAGGAVPIVGRAAFTPATGKQVVASTNAAAPTAIVAAPAFVADGISVYRIDFFVPAVDISVTGSGTGTSLNVQCLRNGGSLGVFGNYNVVPTNGVYGSVPMALSIFDTPPAGSITYSIGAFKGLSGGASANMAVYGDLAAFPNPTLSAPGFIAIYNVS